MKVSKISNRVSNLKNATKNHIGTSKIPSFGSKVVYEDSVKPLSEDMKNFIDNFEEECQKGDDETRKTDYFSYSSSYHRDIWDFLNGSDTKSKDCHAKIRKKDNGESGNVYHVLGSYTEANNPTKNETWDFAIKESKPLKYTNRKTDDIGGLHHEYKALIKAHNASPDNTQIPIAYVETEKGGKFMLSEWMNDITPVNSSTSKESASQSSTTEINETYIRSALSTLEKFDKNHLFNPDATRSNIQIDENNKNAKFLDFQWMLTDNEYYNKDRVFTFAPFEKETNYAPLEAGIIADYPVGELKKHKKLKMAFKTNESIDDVKAHVRNKLKEYYKIRSEFAAKSFSDFEKIKAEVYKNPSDDVIDAELLRLSILRHHRLQFLYSDPNIERPRSMMKLVRHCGLAKCSADMLADFKPSTEPKTKAEKEYFDYMNKLGKFWSNKQSTWYPATIRYLANAIEGKVKAQGKYFPELLAKTDPEEHTEFQVIKYNIDNIKNIHDATEASSTNIERILYTGQQEGEIDYTELNNLLISLYGGQN